MKTHIFSRSFYLFYRPKTYILSYVYRTSKNECFASDLSNWQSIRLYVYYEGDYELQKGEFGL